MTRLPRVEEIYYRLEPEGIIVYEVERVKKTPIGTRCTFKIIKILGKGSVYRQVNNRDSYILKKGEELPPFFTRQELIRKII
jgi:hypothetical protein